MERFGLSLAVLILALSGVAKSTPMVIDREDFQALGLGKSVVLENFREFENLGPQPGPLVLSNGVFTASSPILREVFRAPLLPGDPIALDSDSYPAGTTRVVYNRPSCDGVPPPTDTTIYLCQDEFVTFSDFPQGTVAWGATIAMAPFSFHRLQVFVEGRSGSLVLDGVDTYGLGFPAFLAFTDPEGLVSVRIRSLTYAIDGGYEFYDIQTVAVPEPRNGAVVALVAISIGWLAARRVRRTREMRCYEFASMTHSDPVRGVTL